MQSSMRRGEIRKILAGDGPAAPRRRQYRPQRLLRTIDEEDTKSALRRTTDEAVERGVFGAPTFFVGGGVRGNDRLDWVEQALRRAAGRYPRDNGKKGVAAIVGVGAGLGPPPSRVASRAGGSRRADGPKRGKAAACRSIGAASSEASLSVDCKAREFVRHSGAPKGLGDVVCFSSTRRCARSVVC
jgi:hypothetical protein